MKSLSRRDVFTGTCAMGMLYATRGFGMTILEIDRITLNAMTLDDLKDAMIYWLYQKNDSNGQFNLFKEAYIRRTHGLYLV